MKIIELTYPHHLKADELPPTVVAIGFFDGVHLGHQKVIQTAVNEATNRGMESAVITFQPHPSIILKNGNEHVKYITPLKEKKAILKQLHVDRLYIITFNKDLSLLSPQKFIDHFIIGLHIKHLIAGFDFTYGHKGQGNMNNISLYAKEFFTYQAISKIESSKEKISSTRVRSFLRTGKIERVNTLLGRIFSLSGTVIMGDQRGRKIGFPTINLQVNVDALLPQSGVYAVQVIHNNHTYQGMANIGVVPTFKKDVIKPTVEVHLFDFNQNLYGEKLEVKFLKFFRHEKKFNHIEELISQLKHDEQEIRKFFLNTFRK